MSEFTSLANQFLIAMPQLGDPNFHRTVTLICEHTPEGAMGIVINRQTDLSLGDVFEQLDIDGRQSRHRNQPIHVGGPVQNSRGFVLHEPVGHWDSTLALTDTLGVSTSRDILVAIGRNEGPERCLVAMGYAGWGAGQLERELEDNAWLSAPSDRVVLFDLPPEARWSAAVRLLGVDLGSLSGEAGHA